MVEKKKKTTRLGCDSYPITLKLFNNIESTCVIAAAIGSSSSKDRLHPKVSIPIYFYNQKKIKLPSVPSTCSQILLFVAIFKKEVKSSLI